MQSAKRFKGSFYRLFGNPKNHISPMKMKLKRTRILIILVIALTCFGTRTNAQGWTFSFNLTTSGPCGANIPPIPTFTIPYLPDQGSCESLRQQILAIRVSQPILNDKGQYIGDCAVFYTVTPCSGSDIVMPVDNFAPGSISIDGLTQGNAFFSPHQSKAIENWIDDYTQKMESMGMNVDRPVTTPFQNIPSTGDPEFDKFYADQTIRFEKPEQGGVVDLTGKAGVVDLPGKAGETEVIKPADVPVNTVPVMGSAPLTVEETERLNALNLKSIPDNRLDESNFRLEESPFWTTPEMISLGTDALKFTAGFVSGGYIAVVGVDVISGVLNKKSGQEIFFDVAGDIVTKKLGDVVGSALGKGSLSIGKLEIKSGLPSGAGVQQDYEIMSQSGQSLIDSWSTGSSIGKK